MIIRIVVLVLVLLSFVPAHAKDKLKVHNWDAYIDESVLRGFEEETGIAVEYTTYSSAEELESDLGSSEYYDVIVPSDFQLSRLIRNGMLLQPDLSRLSNRSTVDRGLFGILSSKKGADRFVVPYMWGVVGLALNDYAYSRLGGDVSWAALFDKGLVGELGSCGAVVLNAREEAISLYLNYKGRSLKSSSALAIERAVDSLLVSGVVLSPSSISDYIKKMSSGAVCAGMAWSGHVTAANDKNDLRFYIPVEGGLIFIDSMAIPANARNVDGAYKFINYMLDPGNAVKNSNATKFIPSLDVVRYPSGVLPSKLIVPTQEERKRLYLLEEISVGQRDAIERSWKKFGSED